MSSRVSNEFLLSFSLGELAIVGEQRTAGGQRIKIQQVDGVRVQSPDGNLVQAATGQGKAGRTGSARTEGVAHVARRACHQARNSVDLPGRNRSGSAGIQNCSERNIAAECILPRSVRRLLAYQVRQIRIAAVSLRQGRHRPGQNRALQPAKPFIIAEEEDLVLDDRSAQSDAELVLPKFALLECRRASSK